MHGITSLFSYDGLVRASPFFILAFYCNACQTVDSIKYLCYDKYIKGATDKRLAPKFIRLKD